MSGLGYTIFEYLIWVAVALAVVIVVFVCLAIALAISSAVNPLAAKWKLISNVKHPQASEPNPIRVIRSFSARIPKFFQRRKADAKRRLGKLQPPESSASSKRRVG